MVMGEQLKEAMGHGEDDEWRGSSPIQFLLCLTEQCQCSRVPGSQQVAVVVLVVLGGATGTPGYL